MATALVTQIAYAVQSLFDPAGTAGRLIDLGKLANYGLLGGSAPTVWLPSELFTAGVNGAWYDPSDTTTLYRDAAGTQPVTAVEQPVGLMLDKRNTSYSVYFDGSVDYLSTPNSSSLLFGSGDFTVEAWVNPATTNHVAACIFTSAYTSGNVQLAISLTGALNNDLVGNYVRVGSFNGSWTESVSSNSLSTNTWSHIAVVRSGNNIYTFINGVLEATMPYSGSLPATTNEFLIGRRWDTYGTYPYLNGNISNLRIVKGTALYTANFTPPTSPLTAVAGTSLLTCGTTWSGNPAITTVGNTRADKLNPFTTGTGNHAFNSSGNSANFPVLSARYNLLTKTEDLSDVAWTKNAATPSATKYTDPNGNISAYLISEQALSNTHYVASSQASVVSGTSYTFSIYLKKGTGSTSPDVIQLSFGTGGFSSDVYVNFNITSSIVSSKGSAVTGASIESVGNGWYRCSMVASASSSSNTTLNVFFVNNNASATRAPVYIGATTSDVYIWGADLRVANDALNQPAYQRVNTATDYDTVGFKPYLRFNGTNQWLQTNSIDFSYGDKMFVSAGVRKLSDAATNMMAEFSSGATFSDGSFALASKVGAADDIWFYSRGTVGSGVAPSGYASPVTKVLTGLGNISGDQSILRVNGAQAASSTADQGTGNYGNYPLYIGARAGSSLWFNGRLYQMVVAGKQASAAEITSTETYLNQKTGAF